MIVKYQNKLSITKTAQVNAKQWLSTNGPAICDRIDAFFATQAGSRPAR